MSSLTSPDNIEYHDGSEAYDPAGAYAALATSTQNAFNNRQLYDFYWDDAADRTAQTGMSSGSEGFQADTLMTYKYNGTDWKAWHTLQPVAFTPTWTNLTVGSATQGWTYILAAGIVTVRGHITLSSSTVGTAPYLTLPLPANELITGAPNGGSEQYMGACMLVDSGTAIYQGAVYTRAVSSVIYASVALTTVSGTYATWSGITATTPFTFGNGDFMTFTFSYQPD